MRDVTHKQDIRRTAVAEGFLTVQLASLDALETGTDKGDLRTLARLVGLAWAKYLPLLLPDAHPVRLTHGDVTLDAVSEDGAEGRLRVRAEVTCIDRTGVELEALSMCLGGLMAAWDALKPFEKDAHGQYPTTRISDVRVVAKDKASSGHEDPRSGRVALIVATDTRLAAGDQTGPALQSRVEAAGHHVVGLARVPDDVAAIQDAVRAAAGDADVILVAGGTGAGPRDVTPEALIALGGIELPGVAERLRAWSATHAGDNAILTRATCRLLDVDGRRVAVAALPGHPRAADAATPLLGPILHAVHVGRGSP